MNIYQYPNLVQTKTSQNEVAHIEWNPSMDLLATKFRNNSLTCSRLLSLQKVWHKQPEGTIDGMAWRPDGRVLAIGGYNEKTKDHTCTLHDVENGQEINTIKVARAITSVSWFQLTPGEDEKEKEEPKKLKKPTLEQITNHSETFSHRLAHEQTQLNILMISTDDGKIRFYALGLFYMGYLTIHKDDGHSKIMKTHTSRCLRYLTVQIHVRNQGCIEETSLKLLKNDTFHDRSREILEISKMYAKITDELEYLDDTMNAITTSWADVLAGLDNKLSSYCSRKNRNPDDSQSGYTFLSADELLQLLVIGFTSDNLEKFLADMSDKGLKKLNNAIEQTCLRVQNLIVKNAQKCCYHLHGDLNTLRELSTDCYYHEVGLDDKFIVDAMRSVGALMFKLTELQQVIDHSLKSSKSFFRWLISIACRMTNEQNNSMVPNDINKTTQQDIQLITDFILENFDYNNDELDALSELANTRDSSQDDSGDEQLLSRPTCSNFTLEQIGQYLKDESLSRLKYSFSKPGSNFWIEFFKQRPELTETKISEKDGSYILPFYPHNPETSLIQEYKNTRKSIQFAFKSVATNMKSVLANQQEIFHFKNFLRNVQASHVKFDFDAKSKYHYTLFESKSGSDFMHSLIRFELSTERYILQTITFEAKESAIDHSQSKGGMSLPEDGYPLQIADSNFYENKDTKTMMLSFLLLDRPTDSTLIVQFDIDEICHGTWFKIDKNNKKSTMFMQSVSNTFHLDLHREPPSEREHSHKMMVKKIKKTTGQRMFLSSGRGVIAFTSCSNKRLHLYELECLPGGSEIQDDEADGDERLDESLIDTDLVV